MYSTWVSEWRVPLMNVTAEMTSRRARKASSAPRPFWTVIDRRAGPVAGEPRRSGFELGRLRRDDRRSGSGSSDGSVAACTVVTKSLRPETRRPCSFSARACSVAAAEHGHLGDAAEVPRVEAADHAGADYADALDTVLRSCSRPRTASSRGSSCQSEPGSSGSEKISRSRRPSQRSASGSARSRRPRRRAARGRWYCASARASRPGGLRGSGRGRARSPRAARARGATSRTSARPRRRLLGSALPPRRAS